MWSAGYQPCGVEPDRYEATFAEDRAEIVAARWRDHDHAGDHRLARRRRRGTTLSRSSNTGSRVRDIEVTSYAELVLAPPRCRYRAPGFLEALRADGVRGRPRAPFWPRVGAARPTSPRSGRRTWPSSRARRWARSKFETDRARFLGRGHDVRTPICRNRRPSAVKHRRCRARPDFRPAASRADSTGRDGARRLLDLVAASRARGARSRRQAPRRERVRARQHARLDAGAGAAASSGHRLGGSSLFQRLAGHVLYADASCVRRPMPSARGAGAPRRSGRRAFPATCRSSCCRIDDDRRHRHRAPAAARPRVLADEAARRSIS